MNPLASICFALLTVAIGCGSDDGPKQEEEETEEEAGECVSMSEPRLPVESFDTSEVSGATIHWPRADCSDGEWTLAGEESTSNSETLTEVEASAWDLITGTKVAEVALALDSGTWRGTASAAGIGIACDSREVVWILQPYTDAGPGQPAGCGGSDNGSDFCGYEIICSDSCDLFACHDGADAMGAWFIYPQLDNAYGPFALEETDDGEFELNNFDDLPSAGLSVAFIACDGTEAVDTAATQVY